MVESVKNYNRIKFPTNLMLSLGIIKQAKREEFESEEEFEERKQAAKKYIGNFYWDYEYAMKDLLAAARAAINADCLDVHGENHSIGYKVGDEEYFCWGYPVNYDIPNKELWHVFFQVCCEAGFIMQIKESEETARICLSILDEIMENAVLINNPEAEILEDSFDKIQEKLSNPDYYSEENEDWKKSIDDNSEILIGGFEGGYAKSYELIAKYHKNPILYSRKVEEIMKYFRSIGVEFLDELEEYFNNPKLISTLRGYREACYILWKSDKNERLLTRTSTLRKVNEIYKTEYTSKGLEPIL